MIKHAIAPVLDNKILREIVEETFDYRNQHRLWSGQDSEEAFAERVKEAPNNPTVKYYLKNPVEYKTNNLGWRTPDNFGGETKGNMFLGCSYTWGTGHNIENVWSYMLNKQIGGDFINLSRPGAGPLLMYYHFMYYIDDFKVDNVFYYVPHHARFHLYHDEEFVQYTPSYNPESQIARVFLQDFNSSLIARIVVDAIAYECQIRDIPFYYFHDKIFFDRDNDIQARDFLHYSVNQMNSLRSVFRGLYDEKKTYRKVG